MMDADSNPPSPRRAAAPWAGLEKIVTGGQTGVDRAALDAALAVGFPVGGWCPRGRQAEDGPLDAIYPLRETPLADYAQRTDWNVRDSDGTLILTREERLRGGTAFTCEAAQARERPVLVMDPDVDGAVSAVQAWLREHAIRTLNVAGPRGSEESGLYEKAYAFIQALLRGIT